VKANADDHLGGTFRRNQVTNCEEAQHSKCQKNRETSTNKQQRKIFALRGHVPYRGCFIKCHEKRERTFHRQRAGLHKGTRSRVSKKVQNLSKPYIRAPFGGRKKLQQEAQGEKKENSSTLPSIGKKLQNKIEDVFAILRCPLGS